MFVFFVGLLRPRAARLGAAEAGKPQNSQLKADLLATHSVGDARLQAVKHLGDAEDLIVRVEVAPGKPCEVGEAEAACLERDARTPFFVQFYIVEQERRVPHRKLIEPVDTEAPVAEAEPLADTGAEHCVSVAGIVEVLAGHQAQVIQLDRTELDRRQDSLALELEARTVLAQTIRLRRAHAVVLAEIARRNFSRENPISADVEIVRVANVRNLVRQEAAWASGSVVRPDRAQLRQTAHF